MECLFYNFDTKLLLLQLVQNFIFPLSTHIFNLLSSSFSIDFFAPIETWDNHAALLFSLFVSFFHYFFIEFTKTSTKPSFRIPLLVVTSVDIFIVFFKTLFKSALIETFSLAVGY